VYKVAWIGRFRTGLSKEAARRDWIDVLGPLGAKVPGVVRYAQNHAVRSLGLVGVSDVELAFDGYSCLWYQDRAAFRAALSTPEYQELSNAATTLFETPGILRMGAAVEERTIIDGPENLFKVVWVVRFRPGIDTKAAHEYWTSTHGPFARKVSGIDRYVQNHVTEPIDARGSLAHPPGSMELDGFSECWFRDRASCDQALSSPEWQAMNEDAENLFDLDTMMAGMSAVIEEHMAKG
jgi:uncharacterized protein (TIGR02118 family)